MNEEARSKDPETSVPVLLLAAGLGQRLRPLTDSVPKCLVPIAGRPLLDYWFDRFRAAGIRDVVINTSHLAEQVREYIEQKNRDSTFRVREFNEPTLLGSAGTVSATFGLFEAAPEVLIVYADNLSDVDLAGLIRFHRSHTDPFTMLLFHAPRPESCGIATLDSTARVVEFVEKPESPSSDLANGGVYVVSFEVYREIVGMRRFDLGHDVLPELVGRMRGWVWNGYHLDIGAPEALERARGDAARVFIGEGTGSR